MRAMSETSIGEDTRDNRLHTPCTPVAVAEPCDGLIARTQEYRDG